MSETIRLRIEPDSDASNADSLQYIQGSVEQLSERESWPDNLTFKVNLVLEEIGLNILSYGGEDPDQKPGIEIVLTSEDDSLTIEVVDDGRPFPQAGRGGVAHRGGDQVEDETPMVRARGEEAGLLDPAPDRGVLHRPDGGAPPDLGDRPGGRLHAKRSTGAALIQRQRTDPTTNSLIQPSTH